MAHRRGLGGSSDVTQCYSVKTGTVSTIVHKKDFIREEEDDDTDDEDEEDVEEDLEGLNVVQSR